MRYSLNTHGSVLASRPTGREVKEALEQDWRASGDARLELDFADILAISPSCADELIGRLYSDLANGEYGDRQIVLLNVNDDHEEILEPILKRRGVLGALVDNSDLRLIAGRAHLEDTYRLAKSLGEFRASEIAARAGLTVPAANNRLGTLLRSHLVRRTEANAAHGGREYVYSTYRP